MTPLKAFAEVEGIVAHCIQSTLKEVPPTIRDAVHDKVIDILESFPTWIDLYETTGQIRFPQADIDIEGLEKEDRDRLADVSQYTCTRRHFLSNSLSLYRPSIMLRPRQGPVANASSPRLTCLSSM